MNIPTAWRSPVATFFEGFIPAFRDKCAANAAAGVLRAMDKLPPARYSARAREIERKLNAEGRGGNVREYADRVAKYVVVEGRLIAASREKTPGHEICVDVSINAYVVRDSAGDELFVYAIPVGEPWLWEGFDPASQISGAIHEYGYWTASPKPINLTAAEWKERGKNWERLSANCAGNRFRHVVIDYGNWVGDDLIRRAIVPEQYEPEGVKKRRPAKKPAASASRP